MPLGSSGLAAVEHVELTEVAEESRDRDGVQEGGRRAGGATWGKSSVSMLVSVEDVVDLDSGDAYLSDTVSGVIVPLIVAPRGAVVAAVVAAAAVIASTSAVVATGVVLAL